MEYKKDLKSKLLLFMNDPTRLQEFFEHINALKQKIKEAQKEDDNKFIEKNLEIPLKWNEYEEERKRLRTQ